LTYLIAGIIGGGFVAAVIFALTRRGGDGVEVDGVIKPPVCDGTGGLFLWMPMPYGCG